MPRRSTPTRTKSHSGDVLQFATTVTSLGKELATISSFPPAVAAISALLLILETVQEIKANQEACLRLAQRAAKILIDVNGQMNGKWEAAPQMLVKNLEKYQDTLAAIQHYMTLQADVNWTKRFSTKASVAESLSDLDEMLTDATQRFQIATLISIHHTVSSPHTETFNNTSSVSPAPQACSDEAGCPISEETENVNLSRPPLTIINPGDFIRLQERPEYPFHRYISFEKKTGYHFQKYEQSEIQVFAPTQMSDGWWSSTTEAEVEGRKVFIRVYDQEPEIAIKDWLRDIKLLQTLFHPNLPQMIGSSARNAPVPFVLLVDVLISTPREIILQNLRLTTVEACAEMLLRFHGEIQDAALFLRQALHLESIQIQSYLDDASIGIGKSNSIILGLPVYSKGHYLTYRNHGIDKSLKHICMGLLPQITDHTTQSDILQICRLFSLMSRRFFARYTPISQPHTFLDEEEVDFDALSAFGEKSISSQRWRRYNPCTSHHFVVGDFGYVPRGSGIDSFVKLGNVCTDELAMFSVTDNAYGVQWNHDRKPSQLSTLPQSSFADGLACWPLVIDDNTRTTGQVIHQAAVAHDEACRFLLQSGESMANEFELDRQSFRLVTGVEIKHDFDICNYVYPATPSVTQTMYLHTGLGMKRSPYLSQTSTRVVKGGIPSALEPGWVCTSKVKVGVIQTVSLAGEPN